MRPWRLRFESLVLAAAECDRAVRECRQLEARAARRRAQLAEALAEHGEPIAPSADWGATLAVARRALVGVEATKRERASQQTTESDLERDVARVSQALEDRRGVVHAWRADWEKVLGTLGLAGNATEPEEALALLDVLSEHFQRA
jgi:hypothetical protein